jgi:hypothetical protein
MDQLPLLSRSGAALPREPKHGTLSEYNNYKCRDACPGNADGYTCRDANRDYRFVKRAEARRAREAAAS